MSNGLLVSAVKLNWPAHGPAPTPPLPSELLRQLEVEARLERVAAADPGQVGSERRQPRLALIDQAVVEREVRRVRDVERHLRNDVARVQLGMELPTVNPTVSRLIRVQSASVSG